MAHDSTLSNNKQHQKKVLVIIFLGTQSIFGSFIRRSTYLTLYHRGFHCLSSDSQPTKLQYVPKVSLPTPLFPCARTRFAIVVARWYGLSIWRSFLSISNCNHLLIFVWYELPCSLASVFSSNSIRYRILAHTWIWKILLILLHPPPHIPYLRWTWPQRIFPVFHIWSFTPCSLNAWKSLSDTRWWTTLIFTNGFPSIKHLRIVLWISRTRFFAPPFATWGFLKLVSGIQGPSAQPMGYFTQKKFHYLPSLCRVSCGLLRVSFFNFIYIFRSFRVLLRFGRR